MEDMLIKTIRVSDKGQIAIPREIRERLNIDKGDELIIVENNQRLLIEKSNKLSKQMTDNFKDLLHFSNQSLKEVWGNPNDDIWNNYIKK